MHNKIDVIQGLRGISVIAVMLFHLAPDVFSLGYLGVDIFFVISGFVITKSITQSIQKGTFSLHDFYARRILRLYPALLTFICISLILIFSMTIIDTNFKVYLRTAISALIGVSNFYLISIDDDYFNPTDDNPFVHTWSLAVEEQFYLFYPIFLVFILNRFRGSQLKFFLLIIIISLIFNLLINNNFFTEFYSIFSRFWELLIGCATYFLISKKNKNFTFIKKIYFLIPLLILVFLLENIHIKLFLISIASMMIIMNYKDNNILNLILKNKILLYFGKISYSLYLWHMVIFFLLSFYFIKLEYYFLSIIFSLIIANISYNFVESNFTKNTYYIKKLKFFFASLSYKIILVFISLIIILFLNLNFVKSIESSLFNIIKKMNIYKEIGDNKETERKKFSFSCHENVTALNNIEKDIDCFLKNNGKNLTLFFGDSHNWSLHPFIQNFNLAKDKIKLSFNSSSFQHPIFSPEDIKIQKIKKIIDNETSNYDEINIILSFDHLLSLNLTKNKKNFYESLSSNYNSFSKEMLSDPKIKIILIEDKPSANLTSGQCRTLKKINLSIIYKNLTNLCDFHRKDLKNFKKIVNIFENIEKRYNNFHFIRTNNYFCDKNKCFFNDKNSEPFFYDKKHLTYKSANLYSLFLNKKIEESINRKK